MTILAEPAASAAAEAEGSPCRNRVNSIINGDCLEVLTRIKEEAIDLVVFSPPYDSIRDYKNEWKFDYSALGKALYRVTKDGGICVLLSSTDD